MTRRKRRSKLHRLPDADRLIVTGAGRVIADGQDVGHYTEQPTTVSVASAGLAHHLGPVLALPAQCERPDPLGTATGTPEVPTLGRGAHIADPDTLRGHQHVPLAAQALADPGLPDDVREALAARLRPPAAEQWTRVPGDQRAALTGQTQGPGRGGEARTAVEAVYDPMTHTTRIGWTSRCLTADQAAAVRARARPYDPLIDGDRI